ncbi:MAG: patatin-like phospholipase family protein [Cyclonatronaceae bacterium]
MIKKLSFISLVPVIVGLVLILPVQATDSADSLKTDRARVGIAFSGGGAKGLAHIGVLKVLEEVNMPIDYITGTSMGALVGGLYAIGYSPEFMQDLVLNLNWNELFSDEIRRRYMPMEEKYWDGRFLITLPFKSGQLRLPAGLVAGQHISMLLSNLTWEYHAVNDYNRLPIPFACIATDLETGEAIVMRSGVLSESIRASISIPTIFTPVRVDSQVVVDGGVVRNLPVSDVVEMGADIVIGVNVSEGLKFADSLRTIVDIMDQTVGFKMYQSVSEETELADIMMNPEVKSYKLLEFDKAQEIINAGEAEARKHYAWLKNLADSLNAITEYTRRRSIQPEINNEVTITGINIEGLVYYSESQLRSELQIEIGSKADRIVITNAIDRLYSLQYFHRISYYLSETEDGFNLNIKVTEREQSTFSFGFNYNNYTNATLLFNSSFKNLVTRGSTLRLTASLGLEPALDAQLIRYVGVRRNIGFQGRINYELKKIDLYDDQGERVSSFDNNSTYAELLFFPVVSSTILIGGGIREEFFSASSGIGFLDFDLSWSNLNLLTAHIWVDNLDKTFFPDRGHSIRADASRSFIFGNTSGYLKVDFNWSSYYNLSRKLVLTNRGQLGFISGDVAPVHHRFFLAGDRGFYGFRRYEVNGTRIKWIQAGLRYEIIEQTYIQPTFNVGNTEDPGNLDLTSQSYHWGWGISFGMQTMIAPVQLILSGSDRHNLQIGFSIGIVF